MDAFEPATTDVDPFPILIASFLDDLTVAGYAPHRLAARRALVLRFARWTQDRHIAAAALGADHLTAFVAARSRGRETQKHERATLRRFVAFLGRRGVLARPPIPTAPLDALADDYVAYLRTDRGLADNSIAIYGPCARAFLTHCVAIGGVRALDTIDAEAIRTFLVARVAGRSSESARLLSVGLRAFLRFLVVRGVLTRDLSGAVPRVRTYQQSRVPVVLSPDEVERALATADRSTPRGRRDYAVLLLLARLGFRASEVMTLELDDIHWRAAEIVVRGKGRQRDHVPLLTDVGDALTQYLREDRGASPSRRVFLRLIPPRVGLSRPCAIDHIVRLSLQGAGIGPHPRHVAHLFRHSLATRMIRHGASLAEIAEVLRHRSQTTTALYAKVSFEALRSVARPWPVQGGAQ
jgi:site-specific recombinase XerD